MHAEKISSNTFRIKTLCSNCGKPGHEFKCCNEPITSFGVINFKIEDSASENFLLKDKFSTENQTYYRVVSRKYPNVKCYISDNIKIFEDPKDNYQIDISCIPYDSQDQMQRFCYYRSKIKFLMVSRRFSLGFIEFIRGKYDVHDANSIINLFRQMTKEEINSINTSEYDDMLYNFLNRHNEDKDTVLSKIYEGKYSIEYCESKVKFNLLRSPTAETGVKWGISFYSNYVKPKWSEPEWGFPKGRRDKKTENNLTCGCREFEEETGYKKNEYSILNRIEPIEERLTGTNGVCYKHIYYLAIDEHEENSPLDECGFDYHEIGDIKLFTYDEAMMHIRPYHEDKKKILTRVYLFILNYLVHLAESLSGL